MEDKNTAKYKSKKFAVSIVEVYKYLCEEKKEFVLSKQILKSGTSIGANLAESECAISRNDFTSKVYIALKEAAETLYWLELLYDTKYIDETRFSKLYEECLELKKMLTATTKTLKNSVKS